jgi:5-methylcytosine-specific restriction endonuclease McrA
VSSAGEQELIEAYDHRCGYCGRSEDEVGKLSIDHMTPLSRGGSNSLCNKIPACRHCNDSKGNKTAEEYLVWLER